MIGVWLAALALADEVRGHLDWQSHPAMHLPWGFFDVGLTDRTPRRSWRHQFKQVAYAPWVAESGVRMMIVGAFAAERARNPDQARELILDQIRFVDRFAAANAHRFAVARSPEHARQLLEQTDRIVLVHSIEGGHLLLRDADDARFWASHGVALVTLVHLRDDELGGAAIHPTLTGPLVNRAGARARRRGERRGLTERGRQAMVELDDAGILVDLSHMSPDTFADALEVCAAHGIPPILTHGKLASIRDTERGITDAQLVDVYKLGGHFAVGLSGRSLSPVDPSRPVPADACWGSLDGFAFHVQTAGAILDAHVADIFGVPGLTPDALSEAQRTALSVGWSGDWNGWVSHSEPTRRCGPRPSPELEIDRRGLAHPGLLPEHWVRVEQQGVDLDPVLRAPERFLQLWEAVRADR